MTTLEPLTPEALESLYRQAHEVGVAVGQLSNLREVFMKGVINGAAQAQEVTSAMTLEAS